MKKMLTFAIMAAITMSALAQTDSTAVQKDSTEGFQFTTIDSVAITPVKDQNRSSTCWAFSTLGFLESEVLRTKGILLDLSPMYVVSKTMIDRATYCVRLYNEPHFAPGGSAYDVIYCMSHYGLVPRDAMPGIRYGWTANDTLPVHAELDKVAGGYLKGLTGLKKISPVWREGLQAIYDTYLGKCPETFDFNGKNYTPKSFVEYLGLKEDDYVSITSYTHHPFYEKFALEVPDNWRMDQMYNVPMEDMMRIIDNALANGYTLAWMAKWVGMSNDKKKEELTKKPLPEKTITQQMRQDAFDNWENTDDHGMQIFGTAHDQNGKRYYMVKNSWGTMRSDYKGIWYVSEAYMQYKTNDILVHKNAIPKDLRKKLKL